MVHFVSTGAAAMPCHGPPLTASGWQAHFRTLDEERRRADIAACDSWPCIAEHRAQRLPRRFDDFDEFTRGGL